MEGGILKKQKLNQYRKKLSKIVTGKIKDPGVKRLVIKEYQVGTNGKLKLQKIKEDLY